MNPAHFDQSAPIDGTRVESATFVQKALVFEELASTNDHALKLAADLELALPVVVVAERQVAGRGRGSNQWWSADGALTFSLIVDFSRFGLSESRWPQASLAAGLAVRDTLAQCAPGHPIGLKWPNDVHLDRKKICGILTEVPPHKQGRMVMGIGVNVNNSFAGAPTELQAIATSLADATGRTFDRTDVLIELLQQLATQLTLLNDDPEALFQNWRKHCVLQGRQVRLQAGQREVAGRCAGIDDDGALLLDTDTGRQRFFGGVVSNVQWT